MLGEERRRMGSWVTLAGMSRARSGMCRSPMTRMRKAMVLKGGRGEERAD